MKVGMRQQTYPLHPVMLSDKISRNFEGADDNHL
jgi:hypothetical protein